MMERSEDPSTEELLEKCLSEGLIDSMHDEGDRVVIIRDNTRFRLRPHQVRRFLESLQAPLNRPDLK